MSKMGQYLVNEMEHKFGGYPQDQNTLCTECHEPYWKHKNSVCPLKGEMDEPNSKGDD